MSTIVDPAMIVRCTACGTRLDDRSAHATCPDCGGLLEVEQDWSGAGLDAGGAALRARFDARLGARGDAASLRSGVWRFAELVLPGASAREIVSHPEGDTPLLARDAVAAHAGVSWLRLKHEGHNPTGSFKDRGMTAALTQAVRVGARAVACASTGNTSASLASYAAHAGLPAFVMVPHGKVALGKLAQTLAYGARVVQVLGDFDDCLRLTREASERLGVYLANSVNPFRVEGQKTIVLELLQQLAWEPPDWIALPAGNLGNTAAFGKALREAHALGLIPRVPRLLAVQAAGAAPFARGFAEGFATRHRVRAETRASAIRIGDPASWDRGVAAIGATRGAVVAVSDDEIMRAKQVIDRAGVGCEPASAASVAGVRALVERGTIMPDERVVAVLTGHLLKDPDAAMEGAELPPPVPVEEVLGRLEGELGG
ncbi:MAG TPA: threonine synthase [Gemmatimonadaceae bacterium]|nr:threonine synthase [Gemmatimonadaceae bacterium]